MARVKAPGIVAIFDYLDDVTKALEEIAEKAEFKDHELYTPTSFHDLIEIAEKKYGPSQVRWFTLTGGLTGAFTGFLMPLWMDYDWPIVVGGKTAGIYSLPAYFIFAFELMILFGSLCTITGMFVMGRFPNPEDTIFDERTSDDKFAIYVPGAQTGGSQSKALKDFGAVEVFAYPVK